VVWAGLALFRGAERGWSRALTVREAQFEAQSSAPMTGRCVAILSSA